MSVSCLSRRLLARALASFTATTVLSAAMAHAASGPTVHTARGCYLVGQRVAVAGAGFAPKRMFDVAIDGVDFGQSTTDATGGFSAQLVPGGLPAGQAQHVEHLNATDGSASAETTFTLTRLAGARFVSLSGTVQTLRGPLEVWGFALDGRSRTVYVHYVTPSGQARATVTVGNTGGQCGYLRTRARRVFPFSASSGAWTLQIDTHSRYTRNPGGPVTRIRVQIRRG